MIEETRKRQALVIIKHVHECDAGMRQRVLYYRNEIARRDNIIAYRALRVTQGALPAELAEIDAEITKSEAEILKLFKEAARLPYRVESRIKNLVTKYTAAYVNAALAQVSTYTLSDLQTVLDPLKVYSDTLKNNYQTLGWTMEQIAVDIETTRAAINIDESAPWEATYADDI